MELNYSGTNKVGKGKRHCCISHTDMKFGTHIKHPKMHKTSSWSYPLKPTGSLPFLNYDVILASLLRFPVVVLFQTAPSVLMGSF